MLEYVTRDDKVECPRHSRVDVSDVDPRFLVVKGVFVGNAMREAADIPIPAAHADAANVRARRSYFGYGEAVAKKLGGQDLYDRAHSHGGPTAAAGSFFAGQSGDFDGVAGIANIAGESSHALIFKIHAFSPCQSLLR